MPDQGVEEEAGKSGGEVKMEGLDAPVGRLGVDDVVDEAGEFGPEVGTLPEEGVDGEGEEEAEGEADDAGGDYGAEGEGDVWAEVEVEGVGEEEDGDFGAEDYAGCGEEDEGEGGAAEGRFGCGAAASVGEEVACC